MRRLRDFFYARPVMGWVLLLLVVTSAAVMGQTMKLTDGTFATKVVLYNAAGTAASIGSGSDCSDDSKVTSAAVSVSSSGNNQIVALSGSTLVEVCGWNLISRGAVEAQWIYGTGSACATGETDLTGAYQLIAQVGAAVSNGGAIQFKTTAGQALCLELSAATQVDGVVTYVQE